MSDETDYDGPSPAELEKIRAEVRKDIEKDRRAAMLKEARKKIERELRLQDGLVTGIAKKDEMVTMTLDLYKGSEAIVINGVAYEHGSTVTVPRHLADYLNEVQFRGHRHQNEIDGKSMTDLFGQKRIAEMFDVRKGKNFGTVLDGSGARRVG